LRIVRELGLQVGTHVWCHSKAGLGLDKIRAHSRHRTIATLMIYVDQHEKDQTQRTLADLVASTVS
jgi:hypothetical protein